jgi:hypothetical protein
MTGDITLFREGQFGSKGSKRYAVAASATLIYPGEPVAKALGGAAVTPAATNTPVVSTDFYAGIATSTSTNTASAAGVVDVMPISPDTVFLIAPKVAATFDTQSEYDALVGDRVLLDLTSEVYTILAADGATYGCVIEPLDVLKYPGKVAFSFRGAVRYNA